MCASARACATRVCGACMRVRVCVYARFRATRVCGACMRRVYAARVCGAYVVCAVCKVRVRLKLTDGHRCETQLARARVYAY